jgi:hypothetical protein
MHIKIIHVFLKKLVIYESVSAVVYGLTFDNIKQVVNHFWESGNAKMGGKEY